MAPLDDTSTTPNGTMRSYLQKYHLDLEVGFMVRDPLAKLPDYFDEWRRLAIQMPSMTKEGTLRDAVAQLPLLDHTQLEGDRELLLAHLQLSIITAGYVWQDGDEGVPKVLPRNIAVPFYHVGKRIGLVPVLCHPTLVMANVVLTDPNGPWEPENMRCMYSMPGSPESDWFFIITALVEIIFARSITPMFTILEELRTVHQRGALRHAWPNVANQTAERLVQPLEDIAVVVKDIQDAFARMQEHLTPSLFFSVIRPFLAGWGGEKNALPDGLVYEGISDKPIKLPGGSGAQSSAFQMLDVLLGVEYTEERRAFMLAMRDCMLPSHKVAVEDLENWPLQLKDFVSFCQCPALTESYNKCIQSIVDLRTYHIQVVTKYIVLPASQAKSRKFVSLDKMGTGGTRLVPFLKVIRDNTKEAQLVSAQRDHLYSTRTVTTTSTRKSALLLFAAAIATLTVGMVVANLQQ